MATKLRKFSTSVSTKTAAFILFITLVTSVIVTLLIADFKDYNYGMIFENEYKNSDRYMSNLYDAVYRIRDLLDITDESSSFIAISDIDENGNMMYDIKNDQETIINSGIFYNSIPSGYGDLAFYFYARDGEKVISNTPNCYEDRSFFEEFENGFYVLDNGLWSTNKITTSIYGLDRYVIFNDKSTVYIAFTDESMWNIQLEWENIRKREILPTFTSLVVQIVFGFIIFIFLIFATGRNPNDKEVHLSIIDKVYSDISIALLIAILISYLLSVVDIAPYSYTTNTSINGRVLFLIIICGILTAASCTVCLVIFLSIVRKIKARTLFKHTFIVKFIFAILYNIYNFFKSFFDGRIFKKYPLTKSLFYRQILFISVSFILVLFVFIFVFAELIPLMFVPPILEVIIVYWYIKGNNKTFKEINKGFNESIEEQMKAERMKVALITNVSHDLKTPLTSIISYIELLSKEFNEQNFTNINEYINILAEKSDRLKNIVSDLFDISKSTSGNIELEYEMLEMKKLIEQTFADMEDKIEKSRLQVKFKLKNEPLYILADGKKMYRVLQNIIDNAIKYSLAGTRIFVELTEIESKAVVFITNTSSYEMDFTVDEVLGRFTRGDRSRSTEGSGLGLSIAESFTKACGGEFYVTVYGDQFKVCIEFPLNN